MKKDQLSLIDELGVDEKWKEEWKDMPEYIQDNKMPVQQIIVSFKTQEDVRKFGELLGCRCTYKTKSLWYPSIKRETPSKFVYKTESNKDGE